MMRREPEKTQGISFFQTYLTVWVLLCMAAGIWLGHTFPAVPQVLEKLQIAGISVPIAVLIWIMMALVKKRVDK